MNKMPGQKHLQNMMSQSQKQMANQQKQMKQAAWLQKQQERESLDESDLGASSSRPTTRWQGTEHFQPDERFSNVEAEVAQLKKQLQSGKLSEEKYNEQLNNLMVQDDKGVWWMMGTKTNAWFRYDGQNWVQSTPPGRWVQESSSSASNKSTTSIQKIKKGHPIRAIFLFIFLLAVFGILGVGAGWIGFEIFEFNAWVPLGIAEIPLLTGIVWVIGLIIALRSAGRTWRGR